MAPMQCFQNALAYLAVAIGYAHEMFIKSTPGDILRIFFFITDAETKEASVFVPGKPFLASLIFARNAHGL
jgi:hypothetical protein